MGGLVTLRAPSHDQPTSPPSQPRGGTVRCRYFDDDHREYVIQRPDTPLPWINYLGTDSYFGIISNTAGGYSFYSDARLRRITRYWYNNVPLDFGGRYIYRRRLCEGDR